MATSKTYTIDFIMDYTDIQPLLNAYYNKRMGLQKDITAHSQPS